ncbi:hypothetical protein CVT26_008328 [Gymnopilus dilepis]|uniref:Uncharacterized protein n=1 Tax=Gymnopilus dilepis TaxID=231916 RepID=A0A409XY33_9AGAR|nr:hypothetical protein CVT26_008328 [Gymnopilus dilepis]
MSRAGLLFLIFFAFIGLVACAPLPERLSDLVQRSDEYFSSLVARAIEKEDPVYSKRSFLPELEVRDFDSDLDEFFRREYDFDLFDERDFEDFEHDFAKREVVMLERRSIFSKIAHAFKHAFHKVGQAFKKVGHAIAHVAKKVAHGIVHVAKKVAHGVVKAAKKVGHFIKTTGAKIAKFGLKVVAAAASVASKIVKFIPGVGTAAGMALKGVAIGANKASDKIHANLGKLGKVSNVLNHVINPLGSAAKHMGKGGKVLGAFFAMLRAGLVSLVFFFAIVSLVVCAPIPDRIAFIERDDDFEQEFLTRSLAILIDREFTNTDAVLSKRDADYTSLLEDRDFDAAYDAHLKVMHDACPLCQLFECHLQRDFDVSLYDERDFDDFEKAVSKREVVVLSRRSIWTKIRDAFKHAFSKVKEGFQKFGHIVKKGFQKVGQGLKKFGGMVKKGFQKVGSGLKKFGGMVKKGFQKAGHAIKKGFQVAGHAIKKGFQVAGHAIKKGFQKVGHFLKTTGAKIAKFGLKIVAAAASVAAKVVKFIPGIGTAASMGLKGLAMGANTASNKIHANLGSKLDKVSHGMDYVINPLGSAAKKMGAGGVVANLLTK